MEIKKKLVQIESFAYSLYLRVREVRIHIEVETKLKEDNRKKFVVIEGGKKD